MRLSVLRLNSPSPRAMMIAEARNENQFKSLLWIAAHKTRMVGGWASGGDSGKPIVVSHQDSPVAKALTEITQKVAAQVSIAAISANNTLLINIVE